MLFASSTERSTGMRVQQRKKRRRSTERQSALQMKPIGLLKLSSLDKAKKAKTFSAVQYTNKKHGLVTMIPLYRSRKFENVIYHYNDKESESFTMTWRNSF